MKSNNPFKTHGIEHLSPSKINLWITDPAFTMTLPSSASIGDTIAIIDYAGTFDSNTCTIGRNSHKIQGATADMTVTTERAAFRLVYVDATQGWLLTQK